MPTRLQYVIVMFVCATLIGCSTELPVASPTLEALQVFSTEATYPLVLNLTQTYQSVNPNLYIETSTNTHQNLLEQLTNQSIVGFVTAQLPVNNAVQLQGVPLAQDALVFVVNPNNPLQNVTLDEVRRIYLGNITNWQELGGQDETITLYSREEGADTRQEFDRMVMGNRRTNPNAQILPSTLAILQTLSQQTNAIAYLPFSAVTPDVKVLMIDNVSPSQSTLLNNSYALRYTIYMVSLEVLPEEYQTFVGWVQSQEGQSRITPPFTTLSSP
jgi:phosphate transport system substrate-binding protein